MNNIDLAEKWSWLHKDEVEGPEWEREDEAERKAWVDLIVEITG
jgi:hypothetical protein